MKKEQLPLFEECEERVANKTAGKLHVFIYTNEPAQTRASDLFRTQLAEAITEHEAYIAREAWEASQISFASMIGNDMSEEEELEIPIYTSVEKFIKAEL